jgi:hypothetical protein
VIGGEVVNPSHALLAGLFGILGGTLALVAIAIYILMRQQLIGSRSKLIWRVVAIASGVVGFGCLIYAVVLSQGG